MALALVPLQWISTVVLPLVPSSLSTGGGVPWRIGYPTCISGEDIVDSAISGADEANLAWAQPELVTCGHILVVGEHAGRWWRREAQI